MEYQDSTSSIPADVFYEDLSTKKVSLRKQSQLNEEKLGSFDSLNPRKNSQPIAVNSRGGGGPQTKPLQNDFTDSHTRSRSNLDAPEICPDLRSTPYSQNQSIMGRFRKKNNKQDRNGGMNPTTWQDGSSSQKKTPYIEDNKSKKSVLDRNYEKSLSLSSSSNKSKIAVVDLSKQTDNKKESALTKQLDAAFKRKFEKDQQNEKDAQKNPGTYTGNKKNINLDMAEVNKKRRSQGVGNNNNQDGGSQSSSEDVKTEQSPINNPKNLQQQFSQATKSQELIQQRYKELWSWQGVKSDTIQFEEYKMEGFLRKFVEKVKFFQKSLHPKRYFMIDFTIASIIIAYEKPKKEQLKQIDKQKDWIVLPFRDITDCYPPQQIIDSKSLPKNWPYAFYLQTQSRLYVLCARRPDERKMWIAGFRYVIASTITVQCIMKYNTEKSESKVKKLTERFHQKAINATSKDPTQNSQKQSTARASDRAKSKMNTPNPDYQTINSQTNSNITQVNRLAPSTSFRRNITEEVYEDGQPHEGQQLFKSSAQIRREKLLKEQERKKNKEKEAAVKDAKSVESKLGIAKWVASARQQKSQQELKIDAEEQARSLESKGRGVEKEDSRNAQKKTQRQTQSTQSFQGSKKKKDISIPGNNADTQESPKVNQIDFKISQGHSDKVKQEYSDQKSKQQSPVQKKNLQSQVNNLINQSIKKVHKEEREKKKKELENKMAQLKQIELALSKERQDSLEVLNKFKHGAFQAVQTKLSAQRTSVADSTRNDSMINLQNKAKMGMAGLQNNSEITKSQVTSIGIKSSLMTNGPQQALQILENSLQNTDKISQRQAVIQDKNKLYFQNQRTNINVDTKESESIRQSLQNIRLKQAQKKQGADVTQHQKEEVETMFAKRIMDNSIVDVSQPITNRIENTGATTQNSLEQIILTNDQFSEDVFAIKKQPEMIVKQVGGGDDDDSKYKGWMDNVGVPKNITDCNQKADHVYKVDSVQPMTCLEDTMSPSNMNFLSQINNSKKTFKNNNNFDKDLEDLSDQNAQFNSIGENMYKLKDEPLVENLRSSLNNNQQQDSNQNSMFRKNHRILNLNTIQNQAQSKLSKRKSKYQQDSIDEAYQKISTQQSPRFQHKKKLMEDLINSQRSYNDEQENQQQQYCNTTRKNQDQEMLGHRFSIGSGNCAPGQNLAAGSRMESQRILRVKRINRSKRHRYDRSAKSSLCNESQNSYSRVLSNKRSSYFESISSANSQKSLVDLFKDRDQYIHETGQYKRHHRCSSKWFRESKKKIRQMRRQEEEAKRSQAQSMCSYSDYNKNLNDQSIIGNDSMPYGMGNIQLKNQNDKINENENGRSSLMADQSKQQLDLVNQNLQKRKKRISIKNSSIINQKIMQKSSQYHQKLLEAPKILNNDYAMESGNMSALSHNKAGRESSAVALKTNAGISQGIPQIAPPARQIRSVLSNHQYQASHNAVYKKESALNRVKEEFDRYMVQSQEKNRERSNESGDKSRDSSKKSRNRRTKIIKIIKRKKPKNVDSILFHNQSTSYGPQIHICDEEQQQQNQNWTSLGRLDGSDIMGSSYVSHTDAVNAQQSLTPVQRGGFAMNLFEQIDQGSNTSVEIETSIQSFYQVPSENSQTGQNIFQKKKKVSARSIQTIETPDQMNMLEKHLRNLNGKLVDVKTKINPKTGKKTRIIKIKRKKSSNRASGSRSPVYSRHHQQTSPHHPLQAAHSIQAINTSQSSTNLQNHNSYYQNDNLSHAFPDPLHLQDPNTAVSTLRQLQRNYQDHMVYSPCKKIASQKMQSSNKHNRSQLGQHSYVQNYELNKVLDEVRNKVRKTISNK